MLIVVERRETFHYYYPMGVHPPGDLTVTKNWVNNHAHVLKFDCYETRRFVEFYLNSIDLALYISGGAQPKLNQKNLNRIEIPLPSQERQKYIVDILDRFDAICNDLTSGLPAEIEARQKQYEYYRDRLLSFKELN
jgi:type I restriction enzyme S subunit